MASAGYGSAPCIIVGASLAGLRAAESARRAGYAGPLIVIGAEREPPYNRPPLSKKPPAESGAETFRLARVLNDVEWILGDAAVAADLEAHTVTLRSGRTLEWSALIVASGLAPRRLAAPGPESGRHVLRTVGDAARLYQDLDARPRIAVVGAGFVGCEIASTARALGADVTVVSKQPVPMVSSVGEMAGAELRRRHELDGVRFRTGVPDSFGGSDRVESMKLSTGEEFAVDVVLEAIGSAPNVGWLEGNGLDLSDGVLCDNILRVEGRPDVFACGDIARFPNTLVDGIPRRVEHWTMATDTGKRAGASAAAYLANAAEDIPPFAPVPSFWSDQCGTRLQSYGSIRLGLDDVRVLEGGLEDEVALGYYRRGELMGVLMLGLFNRHKHYHEQVALQSIAR
jgi:3-phenylpropionate/trans-cinnamate dioxygenase ferredoxin reductase component